MLQETVSVMQWTAPGIFRFGAEASTVEVPADGENEVPVEEEDETVQAPAEDNVPRLGTFFAS